MSRIILCKLGPRLGELRKLLDCNTSVPLVLNQHETVDKKTLQNLRLDHGKQYSKSHGISYFEKLIYIII